MLRNAACHLGEQTETSTKETRRLVHFLSPYIYPNNYRQWRKVKFTHTKLMLHIGFAYGGQAMKNCNNKGECVKKDLDWEMKAASASAIQEM